MSYRNKCAVAETIGSWLKGQMMSIYCFLEAETLLDGVDGYCEVPYILRTYLFGLLLFLPSDLSGI